MDRAKVVVYTTSIGFNRKLLANCQRAIQIVRAFKVRYEERDIFNFEHHKEGLWSRLGLERRVHYDDKTFIFMFSARNCLTKFMKSKILCKLLKSGAKFPAMPRIYIDGTYIGGIDELEATADCGDLKKRLNKMPKLQVNSIPTNRISNQ